MKKNQLLAAIQAALFTVAVSGATTLSAKPSAPNAPPPKAAKKKVPSSPGARKGIIKTDKHIYYPGDTLEIRVVMPRSLKAVWNGEADSHIVVYVPDGTAIPVPLTIDVPDKVSSWFTLEDLDTNDLAEGDYQLGLVLTVPGGDPLLIDDWYNGFQGLVTSVRLKFGSAPDPEEDADGDGEFDNDEDGDGFDEEEVDDEEANALEDDGNDDSGSEVDAGDEEADADDEEADADDEEADADDEEVDAGDEEADAGDEEVDAGDEEADVDDEEADAGDEEVDAGDEEADAGDEEADADDEEADAGDEEVDAGDEEADAGDEVSNEAVVIPDSDDGEIVDDTIVEDVTDEGTV